MTSVLGRIRRRVRGEFRLVSKHLGKRHTLVVKVPLNVSLLSVTSAAQLILYVGGTPYTLPLMTAMNAFGHFQNANTVWEARRLFGL